MSEIISFLSFSKLISHVFPGFLFVLSIFMLIDSFCINPGAYTIEISKGPEEFVAFIGIFLIVGTIMGIIIDGIQHIVITPFIDKRINRKEKMRKIKKIYGIINAKLLEKFYDRYELNINDKSTITDGLINYLFCWDEITDNEKKFKKYITKHFDVKWIKNEDIIQDNNTIRIEDGNNKSLSFELIDDNKAILKINNEKIEEFIVKKENNKIYIYEKEILDWFFYIPLIKKENFDVYTNELYYYYEFFVNISLVLLVTTFAVYCYTEKVQNNLCFDIFEQIPFNLLLSIIVFLIAIVCIKIAWKLFEICYVVRFKIIFGTFVEKTMTKNDEQST